MTMDDNKADLAHFFSGEILRRAAYLPANCEVVAGGGCPDPLNAGSSRRDVFHLAANHEEADTRLILHALDAYRNNYKRIEVRCRDTDVLLLLLFHLGRFEIEVCMVAGTAKQRKCFPVHLIVRKLNGDVLICFYMHHF